MGKITMGVFTKEIRKKHSRTYLKAILDRINNGEGYMSIGMSSGLIKFNEFLIMETISKETAKRWARDNRMSCWYSPDLNKHIVGSDTPLLRRKYGDNLTPVDPEWNGGRPVPVR